MPETLTLTGFDELQDLYDGVAEDFADIDYTPWMEGELDHLADKSLEMFNRAESPDGVAWAANAESTIRQKGHAVPLRGRESKRVIRKVKGVKYRTIRKHSRFRLAFSLTTKSRTSVGDSIREAIQGSDSAHLAFGTTVEYSLFNDFGTSRIPARPHIGISEGHLDQVVERCADYTMRRMRGLKR
jgi:phage gpG-like protein